MKDFFCVLGFGIAMIIVWVIVFTGVYTTLFYLATHILRYFGLSL